MKSFFTRHVISVLLLVLPVLLRAQNVITIAGNGAAGYMGDNGPAISAEFDHPDVVKFDHSGNMYIADEHNHVIRKINTSGIITTIAGTGFGAGTLDGGYTGDGGQATNAELSRPIDVTFDAAGNLYFAEFGNGTIRKITLSGIITTIAGTGLSGYSGDNGPATAAQLSDPFGLVFDTAGNLYFGDNANRRVRKINTEGIITTIAGTGMGGYTGDGGPATAANISIAGYIKFNLSGELCISDYFNHVIRKINSAGIITTIIGNGSATNSGDGGPATAAGFVEPWGLLFDQTGNLYTSDRVTAIIRKIDTSGIVTTIAGNDTVGYGGDGGPATAAEFNTDVFCSAVDAGGNLYIADPNNNRIREIIYNTTGVNNVVNTQNYVSIYPNPTSNEVIIKTTGTMSEIEILNPIGQAVYRQQYNNTNSAEINICNLSTGIHFVKVNGVYAGKFVKE